MGGNFYGDIMTTDAVMILDYKMIRSSLNDSKSWVSYEITHPRLLNVSEDTASLISSASASRKKMQSLFTPLWRVLTH